MTVTQRLIVWHDLQALGLAVLCLLGALVVWLLQCLFLWALTSIALGWSVLTPRVSFICAGIPTYSLVRSLSKMKIWQRSWKDSLPEYENDSAISGARLMARGIDLSSGAGESMITLVTTAAPRMMRATFDEVARLIPPTLNESLKLEQVRENLAARNSWELLRDFKNREPEIRKLAALGLVTVREISGIWSLRISLSGQRQ